MADDSDLPYIDPKLVEVWTRGGLSTLVLGPFDLKDAKSFRHRLYATRTKMRRLRLPEVEMANRATIAVRLIDAQTAHVIIYPANQMINAALEAVGITTNDPPPLE